MALLSLGSQWGAADGAGDWFGSVTIQNLEKYKARIDFSNTAGGNIATGDWTTLEPHASKTFSAGNLGLPDGGAGVAVRASWYFDTNGGVKPGEDICPSSQQQVTEGVTRGATMARISSTRRASSASKGSSMP